MVEAAGDFVPMGFLPGGDFFGNGAEGIEVSRGITVAEGMVGNEVKAVAEQGAESGGGGIVHSGTLTARGRACKFGRGRMEGHFLASGHADGGDFGAFHGS